MRGIISPKLVPLLEQANIAIAAAKATGQGFSAELVRQGLDNLSALMGSGPNIAIVKDTILASSSHNIPVRIYNPAPNEVLPVLLHFHGGGHMCGSADLYDPISRKLALATQAIVICVDYRLAPEYPYPAGLDDCQQVLERYQSLLTEMKYSDELYIAGDSAGGAICTSLVMNNSINEKTSDSIKIDKQILVYPSVDYTMASASIDENGQGFLLEKDKMHWYFQQYFQVSSLEQDEITQTKIVKASPLLGKFSANMPTTLVITAGCDPLRDEGVAYAKSLKEVGVNVEHHSFDGMTHAYMLLNDLVSDECQQTYQLIGQFVKAGINDQ
ncbi:alpha/beta hydrolase [Colwellia sp. Bg11-28]|uniref:alpha/beta hydrolase n=1 Tax=Colwellia sp. Bg11-28 TaxID=2058305 RepID=UPI000C32A0A1|nr:alpha/beta hydrolase [Colwellia sp. Bg11-28]PKH89508.1 alpha/beta hydrolase [Colwellia sp. Bg11-28]